MNKPYYNFDENPESDSTSFDDLRSSIFQRLYVDALEQRFTHFKCVVLPKMLEDNLIDQKGLEILYKDSAELFSKLSQHSDEIYLDKDDVFPIQDPLVKKRLMNCLDKILSE